MTRSTFHNAVITGACGGFGRALARELIVSGTQVALVGLQGPALHALAALAPERCAVYTPDVSNSPAMQSMAIDWMAKALVSHAPDSWVQESIHFLHPSSVDGLLRAVLNGNAETVECLFVRMIETVLQGAGLRHELRRTNNLAMSTFDVDC